jgi:hypothetical protein
MKPKRVPATVVDPTLQRYARMLRCVAGQLEAAAYQRERAHAVRAEVVRMLRPVLQWSQAKSEKVNP